MCTCNLQKKPFARIGFRGAVRAEVSEVGTEKQIFLPHLLEQHDTNSATEHKQYMYLGSRQRKGTYTNFQEGASKSTRAIEMYA